MLSLILSHVVQRYPRDSPPVSSLITVLQHVFVLCILHLLCDSLEVRIMLKSVGWGIRVSGSGLAGYPLLSHSILYPFFDNLIYCVKKIIPFALVFPKATNFVIYNGYMRV